MKRNLVLILMAAALTAGAWAQEFTQPVGEPDAGSIGVSTAQQKLKEVSVSKFEDAGLWYSSMSRDQGRATIRRIESAGSLDKEPVEDEKQLGLEETDKYVLGMKVEFYQRAVAEFSLYPSKPLPIEGICKTVSVWVIGRNTNHVLKLLISDQFGNRGELTMGKLNFTGWRKVTVAIPPHIIQRDYHYNNKMGIQIDGFKVACDVAETYGSYYLYLDDLRATTDLFAEENRDTDDVADVW